MSTEFNAGAARDVTGIASKLLDLTQIDDMGVVVAVSDCGELMLATVMGGEVKAALAISIPAAASLALATEAEVLGGADLAGFTLGSEA